MEVDRSVEVAEVAAVAGVAVACRRQVRGQLDVVLIEFDVEVFEFGFVAPGDCATINEVGCWDQAVGYETP